MDIKCFLIEETGEYFQYLRRFRHGAVHDCPKNSYHDASILIEEKGKVGPKGYITCDDDYQLIRKYREQFPQFCDCGYKFDPEDHFQIFKERIYKDQSGNLFTLNNVPVGAIWRASWYEEDMPEMCGLDGKSYMVKTPGGEWCIDGKASNCTRPDDSKHKCWCRHGEAPNFTVDKIGDTCVAGAGSILIGKYHGFLRNGHLTDC